MTGSKLSQDAQTRIQTMVRTQDGFELAEVDLSLRGPGDVMGTQQSGVLPFLIANLKKDVDILKTVRHAVDTLLQNDPNLSLSINENIRVGALVNPTRKKYLEVHWVNTAQKNHLNCIFVVQIIRMQISFNWLRDFIKTDLSASEVGEILTDLGLEVEGINQYQSIPGGLEGVVIGKIVTCDKHPNADKLKITQVDIGEAEHVQIVCGAP
jgi:tRNA-binding EMAP/Myf-like protein